MNRVYPFSVQKCNGSQKRLKRTVLIIALLAQMPTATYNRTVASNRR